MAHASAWQRTGTCVKKEQCAWELIPCVRLKMDTACLSSQSSYKEREARSTPKTDLGQSIEKATFDCLQNDWILSLSLSLIRKKLSLGTLLQQEICNHCKAKMALPPFAPRGDLAIKKLSKYKSRNHVLLNIIEIALLYQFHLLPGTYSNCIAALALNSQLPSWNV